MKKPQHLSATFIFDDNVSKMLKDALAFYIAISTAPGNTHVTIAQALITAAQGRVATAQNAEIAAATKAVGTAGARDIAVAAVMVDVRTFEAVVQTAITNAPDRLTAITIAQECLLHPKSPIIINKNDFKAENDTTTSGVVDIMFKAAAKGLHACYELQESIDGINFTPAIVLPDSHYKFTHGKPAGTKLWFRGRISLSVKRGGPQTWLYPVDMFLFTK
jgi:hypothetical protein